MKNFLCYTPGIADAVGIAIDRLGAPITAVGATAARNYVEREETVLRVPGLPILVNINQIPSGKREAVQILQEFATAGVLNLSSAVAVGQPRDGGDRVTLRQLEQCGLAFAKQHVIESSS